MSPAPPPPDDDFPAQVAAAAAGHDPGTTPADLLREDHLVYAGRGAAAVTRRRGWVLVTAARRGLGDAELPFALEELDTGTSAYLVAAAAWAVRTRPVPDPYLAPFVVRAIATVRGRDEPVSLDEYGGVPTASAVTTPLRELFATLAWLGPAAGAVRPDLDRLRAEGGWLSRALRPEFDRALAAVGPPADGESCCRPPAGWGGWVSWVAPARRGCGPVADLGVEDQDGGRTTFGRLVVGRPTVLTFFYTRCDNPLKCSLTVARLADLRRELAARGLTARVGIVAVTYDPGYDTPDRLRRYADNRGLAGSDVRLVRVPDDFAAVARHYRLGVGFIGSVVNRHRTELFVLDASGAVAAAYPRLRWDVADVADRAAGLLSRPPRAGATAVVGALASVGLAVVPKCPVCWAAYLSAAGITGLESLASAGPWLLPVLAGLVVVNLAALWRRGRATGRRGPFRVVLTGVGLVAASRLTPGPPSLAAAGVLVVAAGSVWSARPGRRRPP